MMSYRRVKERGSDSESPREEHTNLISNDEEEEEENDESDFPIIKLMKDKKSWLQRLWKCH